jgi:hypothetical protein
VAEVRFYQVVIDRADPHRLPAGPESKVVKNRVHIDFAAADEEASAKEIEGMAATRRWVSEDPDDPFVVACRPRRQRVLHRSGEGLRRATRVPDPHVGEVSSHR